MLERNEHDFDEKHKRALVAATAGIIQRCKLFNEQLEVSLMTCRRMLQSYLSVLHSSFVDEKLTRLYAYEFTAEYASEHLQGLLYRGGTLPIVVRSTQPPTIKLTRPGGITSIAIKKNLEESKEKKEKAGLQPPYVLQSKKHLKHLKQRVVVMRGAYTAAETQLFEAKDILEESERCFERYLSGNLTKVK